MWQTTCSVISLPNTVTSSHTTQTNTFYVDWIICPYIFAKLSWFKCTERSKETGRSAAMVFKDLK